MLSEHDLVCEIEKYNSKADLSPSECVKLAAFYTILNCQYPVEIPQSNSQSISMASEEATEKMINVDGDSEFIKAIDGRYSTEIWSIMDELMQTLQVINPRLYAGVMRKIQD